jgi:hypothetical protein
MLPKGYHSSHTWNYENWSDGSNVKQKGQTNKSTRKPGDIKFYILVSCAVIFHTTEQIEFEANPSSYKKVLSVSRGKWAEAWR